MSFLNIEVDTKKITSLNAKLAKYPPVAIRAGLEAASEFMNTTEFKGSMYPPKPNGRFVWSTEKQRRAFFASDGFGRGIPTRRTFELRDSGEFRVIPSSFMVGYKSTAEGAQYVISEGRQIIGHKVNNWRHVGVFVSRNSAKIAQIFRKAVKEAWSKMESFMFGGGGGL